MAIVRIDSNNISGNYDGLSWATAFQSLNDAVNDSVNPIVAHDDVWFAHNHLASYGSSVSITVPDDLCFYSVNSSDDSYQPGAIEQSISSNTTDLTIISGLDAALFILGVSFKAGDLLRIQQNFGQKLIMTDCKLFAANTTTGADIRLGRDVGQVSKLYDTEFVFSSAGPVNAGVIEFGASGQLVLLDHVFASGEKQHNLFEHSGNGGQIEIYNTDLSTFIKDNGALVYDYLKTDDYLSIRLERCILPPGMTVLSAGKLFGNSNYKVEILGCALANSSGNYNYFYIDDGGSTIEQNISTYLTASSDGVNKFSVDLSTSSMVCKAAPLRYKLCTLSAQDLTSAKTYSVNFTCNNALTNSDFWLEAEYPNELHNALGEIKSSRAGNSLSAGDAHAVNAQPWVAPLAVTQQDDISIGPLAGVNNANVTIYVNLAKADEDVVVCPQVIVS